MKRATIYLQEDLHKALRIKAFEADKSVSDLVNDAVRVALEEDIEDLTDLEARRREKPVSYHDFLKELKNRGQI
jgi:plasmid stability protein